MANGNAPVVDLGPGTLKAALADTGKALVLVQTYAKNITTQPIIIGLDDVIPNLSKHQQAAVKHADAWLTNYQCQLLQVQSDLLSFSNGFAAYYNPLLALGRQIQDGDRSKVAQFCLGLQALTQQVTANQRRAAEVVGNLNIFSSALGSDVANFTTDAMTAQSVILGKDGLLAKKNEELAAISAAIKKDTTLIAGGAVAAVVGGLIICVGALAPLPGSVKVGLIIAGIAVIGGGGGTLIGLGAKDLAAKQNDYSRVSAEVNKINSGLTVLRTVQAQLDFFQAEASGAHDAVVMLDTGYQTLGTRFTSLVTDLQTRIDTTSPFLVAALEQAYLDWLSVKMQIENVQQYGAIGTTNLTVGEYLKSVA